MSDLTDETLQSIQQVTSLEPIALTELSHNLWSQQIIQKRKHQPIIKIQKQEAKTTKNNTKLCKLTRLMSHCHSHNKKVPPRTSQNTQHHTLRLPLNLWQAM